MNSLMLAMLLMIVISSKLCVYVSSKTCTNLITEQMLTSNSHTLQNEMFSHYHLTPTDESTWSTLYPRKMLREEEAADDHDDWVKMYKKIKHLGRAKGVRGFLNEVPLHDVRLAPSSIHGVAQQTNLEYLLMLDVDRLAWSFRKMARLETPGEPYGGWEGPNVELRGHFVGHYLSASAQMWASTHNDSLKEKMTALVSALSACQEKIGTGYLSAFPTELFDRLEAVKPVWAPYYTIHKILAGLLDQYTLAGNDQALNMTVWMVDYFYNRVQNVISKHTIERHWATLNEEAGGMNDLLYKLYSVTGDQKHLLLGHLFDKPCFLGLLAVKVDDLAGFHANTHIPVVVGSQMRYEVTGDLMYKEIGTFFMDIVNSSHTYATGGTSVSEFWTDPKRLADTLRTENEESCATYNMLKVSRHLWRWSKEMAYADYYERALTNGVLSIQRGTDPGTMIYMLPLGRGVSKAVSYHGWGTKFNSFWCCYGTGIESFSKLGDSIYFEEEEEGKMGSLYIVQYISSSLQWRSQNISLKQEVKPVSSWDSCFHVELALTSKEEGAGRACTLKFRIPLWTHSNGAKATLNGENVLNISSPGSFLSVSRNWNIGDKITLELPILLRTEAIKDDRPKYASLQAIFYGPYLLAGLSNGDWDLNAKSTKSLSDCITPIPAHYNSHLISLSQESGDSTFVLTKSNTSLKMKTFPLPGTNTSVNATFRLILKDHGNLSKPDDAIGKLVMLEPFDLPGQAIVHFGEGQNLGVADPNKGSGSAFFRLVAGLDGKKNTVSLEAEDQKGCFAYKNGKGVIVLGRDSKSLDEGFKRAASFNWRKGISEYHPVSFVAKGIRRNFVLSPLLSLRDEFYTVYFRIHS